MLRFADDIVAIKRQWSGHHNISDYLRNNELDNEEWIQYENKQNKNILVCIRNERTQTKKKTKWIH